MFKKYIDYLDNDELKKFLELLDSYTSKDEERNVIKRQLINLSIEELSKIFESAKNNPELQIEIWRVLPSELVKNPENSKVFEAILENKFGEYIQEIDKKELVKLLNSSREISRSTGWKW